MSRLGARLRELRGSLSLYEVGKGSGVATADLSRYEQGKYLPTSVNLRKLAGYYEVPYEDLRFIYYEDFFSDPEEQAVVLNWAYQKHMLLSASKKDGAKTLVKLLLVPQEKRKIILKKLEEMIETSLKL